MVGRRHLVHGERLHLVLLLSLTFSTGIVDAVGYLGLDRVFAGNMTGNIVILGMGLAGADGLPVIGPLLALVTFVLGASAAGLAMRGVRALNECMVKLLPADQRCVSLHPRPELQAPLDTSPSLRALLLDLVLRSRLVISHLSGPLCLVC